MAESKYKFMSLTPVDDIDLNVYEDAINYVFDNSDIKNVAVSGAYSAGKSSVLASYRKNHPDLRFLHISLAHFQSPDQDDNPNVKESVLEGKILNQLVHQIPSDQIPQTNFRVKKVIKIKGIIKETLGIVLLLVATINFMFFDLWKSYVSTLADNWLRLILEIFTHQYILLLDSIIIIGVSCFIIYELVKLQKNRYVFRKLKLQGNEIEIFEESKDSYFDKYLNEVLYLFENADADVIVFEDMDRFNANKIFERLREINMLANIQLEKENKKILRFFYLLRDDIFVSKDRTKFFDYIMPVVPVVDSSNSYDQFISLFENSGLFEKFDRSFLQGLSLYIDDMRLLKNVYNEFLVYYNRLNITELDCNKMLAIVAYKNLFPHDFGDLQLNQGFVYTLFDKKDEFIRKEILEIKKRIEETQNKINFAQSEHLTTIRELNIAIADKYMRGYNFSQRDDESLSTYIMSNLRGDDLNRYNYRKEILNNKLNGNIFRMNEEIFHMDQELIVIKNKQLRLIITRNNINEIFSTTSTNEIGNVTDFNDIKSSEYFDCLKYLIRNGYIDETYADYMTYFYENSLSRIDKAFLRSVTDKKAKEYTYQLKNPRLVVSRLRLFDFSQEEILNFDLFTYLLHTKSHMEYIEKYIEQLKDTKNFKFIGEFFNMTKAFPDYIKYLNSGWPETFITALNEKGLNEKQLRRYSVFSIYYSDDATIALINKDNCLCNYISNARDYLAIEDPDIEKLIYVFKLIEVCFIGFDYELLNRDLFRAVYEESLYEINSENLQLMQKEIFGIKNDEDIFHKNYTILFSRPDSAITQYVDQNISKYFDIVFHMSGGNILDDENVAVAVLNNSNIANEQKHSYIHELQTVITSINEIKDNSLWSLLLDANTALYSEQNIMDYFNAVKLLDESIVSFINKCDTDLDFSKVEYDSENKENLFDGVVGCNSIVNSMYEQILVSLGFYYEAFNVSNISDEKIIILIDANIIKMTAKTIQFMRDNYSNQIFHFIKKNINEYAEIMDSSLVVQNELLEIITWDISDELKIKLLEFIGDKISIIKNKYSPAVCTYILNNNFMASELSILFESFEEWDESIQMIIFNFAINNIRSIIDAPRAISEKLKDNLIRSDELDRDAKLDLLIVMMPFIKEDYIKEILNLMNLTSYIKVFDKGSRPTFEINDESEKLLTAFKEKDLIYNFEKSHEKDGYYKIQRSKPKKLYQKS